MREDGDEELAWDVEEGGVVFEGFLLAFLLFAFCALGVDWDCYRGID